MWSPFLQFQPPPGEVLFTQPFHPSSLPTLPAFSAETDTTAYVQRELLELGEEKLGCGVFGPVLKGVYRTHEGKVGILYTTSQLDWSARKYLLYKIFNIYLQSMFCQVGRRPMKQNSICTCSLHLCNCTNSVDVELVETRGLPCSMQLNKWLNQLNRLPCTIAANDIQILRNGHVA